MTNKQQTKKPRPKPITTQVYKGSSHKTEVILIAFGLIVLTLYLVYAGRTFLSSEANRLPSGFVRKIDEEAGVVCWESDAFFGGIDCMPIEETRLEK